ncbi:transketolase [Hyphomicrobiales bacterium 4NK60-0047b]
MGEAVEMNKELDMALKAKMANAIRALSMDAVQKAKSGHPGAPMGLADVATVLFADHMKFDAANPDWHDRDRFIMSAGHGSMLVYSLLYLAGYPGIDIETIKNFRQIGSPAAGHPEYGHLPGIETTTGPLGQGITTAVGMALAERLQNEKYGDYIIDHYTYVIAGDGCLMEGISQEAISMAGHLGLSKLIVLWDDNNISIDGTLDMACSDDQRKRFEASGWNTIAVDGHDMAAVSAAIAEAKTSDKPTLIACKTIIGFGSPNKQGTSATHGAPLGDDEIAETRKKLGWDHPPFEVPQDVLDAWRGVGRKGADKRNAWLSAYTGLTPAGQAELVTPMSEPVKKSLSHAVVTAKKKFVEGGAALATRVSSKQVLDDILPVIPGMIGGSADLTGSNGTKTDQYKPVNRGQFDGNYIHYGVREHGMGAVMNGLSLHGGFLPYSGTFLVFSDYARGAIRLSALMEQAVGYVMTHDSIGLGEDGPTHQPVEHLASLRAMPNINVFRPADSVECAECWEAFVLQDKTPAIMSLTRQNLPLLRDDATDENKSAKGGYVLKEASGERDVTLIGTGSEVSIAMDAAKILEADGLKVAVVSLPCWELFEAQSSDYQWNVLGDAPRVGVEAAVEQGWSKWLGSNGQFIGMSGFGASGPWNELYEHFGITAEKVADAARRVTGNA